jgi:hypothetical protein
MSFLSRGAIFGGRIHKHAAINIAAAIVRMNTTAG